MKTGVSLKYFQTDCLWKTFLDPISSHTSLNLTFYLISSTILVIVRLSTLFQTKVRAIKWQKMAKASLP